MDKEDLFKYRSSLWDYFSMHADQRLKTFNYYLIVFAIFTGAFTNNLKENQNYTLLSIIPFLSSIVSFVFWKLDKRNRQMIKNAEIAIKSIDDLLVINAIGEVNPINIFRYDDLVDLKQNEKKHFFHKSYSYSNCFGIIFFVFTASGLLTSLYYCYKLLR